MYGNKVRLSSLHGKVILVDFWSAMAGNSNQLNAELKELYAKYAERGFEIYQVGIESSKAVWVSAVQEQKLPWISVSDLQGTASTAVKMYNVQNVPTNFLIDREGNIVGKDLYGAELAKHVAALI
jgi:glutathione peroxidase-family protein